MTDWHPEPDELLGLALAEPDAAAQERLVAHLGTCSACRNEYGALSDGVQQVLAATPAVAPPAGFSGRVLAAMTPPAPARTVMPARWLMAACVLVGLLLGVGGVLGWRALADRPPASGSAHDTAAAQLLTADGAVIGTVGLATREGRQFLLITVTAGRDGARYDCILVGADGSRVSGGRWTLADEYGRGTASGAWLVPISGTAPASVELVTPTGTIWARAAW